MVQNEVTTWTPPITRLTGSYQKIHRNKYHHQTSAGEPTSYSVSDGSNSTEHGKVDNSPIPIKPALVRGVSSKRKVPPIPLENNNKDLRDEELFETTRNNLFTDDDGADDEDDEDDDDSDLEYKMSNSLRMIHNSASRKKIVKTVQPLEQQHVPSSLGNQTSPSEENNKGHKIKKKPDMPFETKPRIARKSNPPSPKTDQAPLSSISKSNVFNHDTKTHSEFKPHGGVTFHKTSSLEVELVGHGYTEDSQNNDTRTTATTVTAAPAQHGPKNKDIKKPHNNTKSVLSPLGLASLSTFGQSEVDDDWLPGGVVGRGMFEVSPHSGEHTLGSNTSWQSGQMSSQSDTNRNLPQGVYGVKVKTTSQGQASDDSDDDGDDVGSIAISKTTKERMAQKYRQKQEEAERKHANHERVELRAVTNDLAQKTRELEQKKKQEELRIKREKERQQEKLRKLSNNNKEEEIKGLSISGSSQHSGANQNSSVLPSNGIGHKRTVNKNISPSKPKPRPPPVPPEQPSHPSSAKSGEPEPTEELRAFNDPYAAYTEAMKMISKEQWDIKYTGINNIRRLVVHHPDMIVQNLHAVNVAIIQEVKNLRSQVSRLAIVCLGEMYTYLKKLMDLDVDQIARVLLAKNGESSGFIRADVDHAVAAMVDNVTPQRAMVALINGGTSHKNVPVRKCAAYHLVSVAERMGPGRILSGVKDLTDKILPVATQFLLDPNPEVRYNGQRILYGLMSHEEFDKMMNKYVSATTLRNVKDKLEVLKKKGLTDPPSESSSARSRRSGQGVRTNSRGHSAVSDHTSQNSASSKKVVRTDEATMEEIKTMCAMMAANDWRDRQKGIQQLIDMTQYNFSAVANNVVKVFDKFIPCLKDSNSKVNLFALQGMMKLVPALKDHLVAVTTLSIQTVASNLSSKNNDIYTAATTVLDIFMEHLDPVLLLHPFANQAQAGNARIKPDMINRVAFLTNEVYPKKPKQVILHVLPLLWHLLGSTPSSGAVPGGTGNLRSAISALVQTLYSCMGQSLLDSANTTSNVTMRMKQTLQDMVENP
ncbi:hypothetical protein LSH36_43g02057 [Paralvinella palmiformis]|uniref:TOG domain-containing protein n=1 Tax=Paralvinella palmiformis TaxID=53620 RepID=A0AAD9NDI3_9ANNE|nr:hypothetical protein LSH36_43g02057 [Paralvinella palmiformis]